MHKKCPVGMILIYLVFFVLVLLFDDPRSFNGVVSLLENFYHYISNMLYSFKTPVGQQGSYWIYSQPYSNGEKEPD